MYTQTERSINELSLAGLFDESSDYAGELGRSVKQLLTVFKDQGHSGASAGRVADIFRRLVNGEILTPLTGQPNEWEEIAQGVFQNIRMPSVFAENDYGKNAYFLDGRIFIAKTGRAFHCSQSRTFIQFPVIPKSIVVREGTEAARDWQHVFEEK